MFFLQASMAPIKVQIGQLFLTINKYTLDEAVAWAQELSEAALEKNTKDMDEVKRREYMLYYAHAYSIRLRLLMKKVTPYLTSHLSKSTKFLNSMGLVG